MRSVAMNPAMAALFGSLVGALGSSVSTWITQRHADRRDLLARRIFYRVQLYSDFITESTRVLVDALENNFQDPDKLIPAYALLSRIRLTASEEVLSKRRGTGKKYRKELRRAKPDTGANPIQSLERQRSVEAFQRDLSR